MHAEEISGNNGYVELSFCAKKLDDKVSGAHIKKKKVQYITLGTPIIQQSNVIQWKSCRKMSAGIELI